MCKIYSSYVMPVQKQVVPWEEYVPTGKSRSFICIIMNTVMDIILLALMAFERAFK